MRTSFSWKFYVEFYSEKCFKNCLKLKKLKPHNDTKTFFLTF